MNPLIKSRKYLMALSTALFLLPLAAAAQEDSSIVNNEPVKATFEHVMLINNHTVEAPYARSLDVGIQHRFGVIKNRKDMFGLYAPSNIRLVVNYGITDKIMVGFGATKNKSLYDLQGKYKILTQKTKGMPVSLVYYGNVTMSDLDDKNFLDLYRMALGEKEDLSDIVLSISDRCSFFLSTVITN